jgi:hypothetical protein
MTDARVPPAAAFFLAARELGVSVTPPDYFEALSAHRRHVPWRESLKAVWDHAQSPAAALRARAELERPAVRETKQDRLALARAGKQPAKLGSAFRLSTIEARERDNDRRAAAALERGERERAELERAGRFAEAEALERAELERGKLERAARAATNNGSARGVAAAKQDKRRERAADRWIEKGLTWARQHGIKDPPPDVPLAVYLMVQEITADATGTRIRDWLKRFRTRFTGVPLNFIRDAALQPLESGGFRYHYAHKIARETIAIGLMFLELAERTQRRKDRWQLIVKGISVDRVCSLLHAPGYAELRPHRNSIGGAGRKTEQARDNAAAKRWKDHVRTTPPRKRAHRTPMQRLRDSGFLYAMQAPRDKVAAWEKDSNGNVRNRYWIATAGLTGDFAELNNTGWNWADESVRTPLRERRRRVPNATPPRASPRAVPQAPTDSEIPY